MGAMVSINMVKQKALVCFTFLFWRVSKYGSSQIIYVLKYLKSEVPILIKFWQKPPMAAKKKKIGFIKIQDVKLEYMKNYYK